jgi:hypothetical protein
MPLGELLDGQEFIMIASKSQVIHYITDSVFLVTISPRVRPILCAETKQYPNAVEYKFFCQELSFLLRLEMGTTVESAFCAAPRWRTRPGVLS